MLFKKRYSKSINFIKVFPCIILFLIFLLTIGFSAFQNELIVHDMWAIVRVKKDIRVTGINLNNVANDGVSYWEEYNVSKIEASIGLPSSNSTVTYEIPITNIGNAEMGIYSITGLPNNLNYSISGYTLKDKLCDDTNTSKCSLGSVSTLLITIGYSENGYDSTSTDYEIDLNFEFKRYFTITYHDFDSTVGLANGILQNESKEITFTNTNGIPIGVSVTSATSSYTSPTLILSNAMGNIDIYKKHSITYVLDGGVQASGQPTLIATNETITLLDATKEEYNFGGWYTNSDFEGEAVTILSDVTNDITLYAQWSQYDYFIREKEFDGTVGNVINTGIALYSEENVNKNFRIKFTIDEYDSSYSTASNINNNQPPTILSSMVETNAPYSGFVYRLVTNGGSTKYSVKVNDSHVTSFLGYYDLEDKIDVEIVREDGIMYTKVNSIKYKKALTYKSDIDTFDVPLTIGGNINATGAYDRLFKGKLSNVSVEFYEGSIVNNVFHYTETKTDNSYQLNGTIEFDGTNYIDTGLNLFSSENINKDFEMSLTIEQLGGNIDQATLINFKDESQNNVWPGVAYRVNKAATYYEITARWPGQANVIINDSVVPPKKLTFVRRDGIIYYSINDETENKLIEVPASSLTKPIGSNLTFGASLNGSLKPFRFFYGIVSNISVKLYD